MTKQTQQQPQQKEQKQNDSQRGKNPDQQGGQNPQGESGKTPLSQGQPGARQADQGSGSRHFWIAHNDSQKNSAWTETKSSCSRS